MTAYQFIHMWYEGEKLCSSHKQRWDCQFARPTERLPSNQDRRWHPHQ